MVGTNRLKQSCYHHSICYHSPAERREERGELTELSPRSPSHPQLHIYPTWTCWARTFVACGSAEEWECAIASHKNVAFILE